MPLLQLSICTCEAKFFDMEFIIATRLGEYWLASLLEWGSYLAPQ